MYPTEYLTHGIGYTGTHEDIAQVITDANGNKQFRISDHLASLRVAIDPTGATHSDFDPWGEPLAGSVTRRSYNDREKDRETGRLNLGVRSMGDGDHFTSIDPLWEKFPSMSPYAYANDNPLRLTDPRGMQAMPRINYVASVEWLKENGGGGGGGAAPLVVIGGLITYATQHSEQSVPFVVGMANDISQALTNPFGLGLMVMASQHSDEPGEKKSPPPPPEIGSKRNPAQDKMLTDGEIKLLEQAGEDVHEIKRGRRTGRVDLYKDAEGNVYIKGKGGKGPGEPMNININDYK